MFLRPVNIFCRYLFRTRNTIGPATLPTCKDYESAVKQFAEANQKRQEKINRNVKALKTYGELEMQRMLEECDEEDQREEEIMEEVLN